MHYKNSIVRFITFFSVLSILVGCGFHLRNSSDFELAVESMSVSSANAYSDFSREIEGIIESRDVALVQSGADYSVRVLTENTSRRPVSTTADISVSDYELRLEIQFSIADVEGQMVIRPTAISTERIYSFDRTSLVGSAEEEQILIAEMRRDLAAQLLRRFSAVLRQGELETSVEKTIEKTGEKTIEKTVDEN